MGANPTAVYDRLDTDLWVWRDPQGIRVAATAPGRDHVLLTPVEARRVALRLLALVNQ